MLLSEHQPQSLLALLALVVQLVAHQERKAALQPFPGQFLILILQRRAVAVALAVKARQFLLEVAAAVWRLPEAMLLALRRVQQEEFQVITAAELELEDMDTILEKGREAPVVQPLVFLLLVGFLLVVLVAVGLGADLMLALLLLAVV